MNKLNDIAKTERKFNSNSKQFTLEWVVDENKRVNSNTKNNVQMKIGEQVRNEYGLKKLETKEQEQPKKRYLIRKEQQTTPKIGSLDFRNLKIQEKKRITRNEREQNTFKIGGQNHKESKKNSHTEISEEQLQRLKIKFEKYKENEEQKKKQIIQQQNKKKERPKSISKPPFRF